MLFQKDEKEKSRLSSIREGMEKSAEKIEILAGLRPLNFCWSSRIKELEFQRKLISGTPQVNITDPDAKIMRHKDRSMTPSYKPSYNCQVAVDEKAQIIVAADVVDEENDLHQMESMIQNVKDTMGYKPTIILADAGYFSYDNLKLLQKEGIDAYIPDNFYKAEKRKKQKVQEIFL